MKYRSLWPTFNLKSNVGSLWLIIQKFDVHPSNSLQERRQNQWTVRYRSHWPSHHDTRGVGAYMWTIPDLQGGSLKWALFFENISLFTFYTFLKNHPEMKGKSPWCPFITYHMYGGEGGGVRGYSEFCLLQGLGCNPDFQPHQKIPTNLGIPQKIPANFIIPKTRGPLVLYCSPECWRYAKISGYWGKNFYVNRKALSLR